MNKVEAFPVIINGQTGYDIRINDHGASVQDYIDALDLFIEKTKFHRSRKPNLESCYGCSLCCRERIPVTLIDALQIDDSNLHKVIRDWLHVYVEDRVVDITLGLDEQGRCRFLNDSKQICGIYQTRPLVCHTFICCPSTLNARQLREDIVNSGEDELVRSWFKTKNESGFLVIHEAVSPAPNPIDYAKTPFFGVIDYNQVKLKKICSEELWTKLV